jgi:predicted methyltransferase
MDVNFSVLSHVQAQILLDAFGRGAAAADISLDLGVTTLTVGLASQGVQPPTGDLLPWEVLRAIAGDANGCYTLEAGVATKIQFFSDLTARAYTLYPTRGAPTMLVSGLPMHRIKDTDPYQDTLEKIRSAKPAGNVLDTCTGLGYTAIQASKLAAQVTTIELDPAALQICRANPWSQALFDNPRITQVVGDSFDEIANFSDGSFSRVIHDPPYFSLAGDLYSLDFYREVFRVLNRNGRMFHYIGDPESKSGRSTTAGVIKRLEQAGFRHIERAPRAFGVVASK